MIACTYACTYVHITYVCTEYGHILMYVQYVRTSEYNKISRAHNSVWCALTVSGVMTSRGEAPRYS